MKSSKKKREKELEEILANHASSAVGAEGILTESHGKGKSEIVMVISDTQFPFEHADTFGFLSAVKKKYRPTQVVHIGDEMDFHALSEYDHDPDGDSAGEEFKKGMVKMKAIYKIFPRVKACISNHTARPYRKAYKYGIPTKFLRGYKDLLEAPEGWEWRDKWEIDGVIYEHGEGMAGEYAHKHAALRNMQSTVMGHLHSNAGVEWAANPRHLVFGFAVGCLIDREAYAFKYGKFEKRKPIISVGIVDKGIPMLIPMQLNKGGRWTGEL